MRNVADTGLQILYTLLQNVAQEEAAAQSFYQTYFCDILQHIFSVVTDTSHTAGELPLLSSVQRHIRHILSFRLEAFILGYLAFSEINVVGRRVLTHRADRRRRPGFETLYRCSCCFESGWFVVCVSFVLKVSLNQQLKTFCLIVTGQQTHHC